jgi:hypothetical protein
MDVRLHVQPGLLFEPPRACDAIIQLVPGTGWGVTIGEQSKDAGWQGDFVGRYRVSALSRGDVGQVEGGLVLDGQFATGKGTGQLCSELIELIGAVPEAVVVSDIVKELLGIQGTPEKQSGIAGRWCG